MRRSHVEQRSSRKPARQCVSDVGMHRDAEDFERSRQEMRERTKEGYYGPKDSRIASPKKK